MCLVTQLCRTLCNPVDCSLPGSSVHGDYPGKNTRLGCHALLQVVFPTQASHIAGGFFYWLSHQGILGWVAYPFSRESSSPRNWTRVSCLAGGFFTNWATREARSIHNLCRGFPGGRMQEVQEMWVQSLGQKIPWGKKWQPTSVFLPEKFHGQRILVAYIPWGHKELDTTE